MASIAGTASCPGRPKNTTATEIATNSESHTIFGLIPNRRSRRRDHVSAWPPRCDATFMDAAIAVSDCTE